MELAIKRINGDLTENEFEVQGETVSVMGGVTAKKYIYIS